MYRTNCRNLTVQLCSELTNVGSCTVSKKSAASFTNCFCFFRSTPLKSGCLTPGENTSGLNLTSNSESRKLPTAAAALRTISFVLSSTIHLEKSSLPNKFFFYNNFFVINIIKFFFSVVLIFTHLLLNK